MPLSDFAKVNVDSVVEKLTTDEAIQLIAGVGFWHTHAIPRLGIPSIKVSDGPNGIRGNHFFMGTPAKCLPCATAMAATWNIELIEQVGLQLLAAEAKLRAASVILAPTCNIQRSPLGGRSFESFSEDPFLSGMITASYINGVQRGGIGSTIKHFVCNDKENDRLGYDSVVSDRALREVYLMPFMLAQKYAQPWAYMTAYNRVNGIHVSENPILLQKILRDEWKFTGMVMSDWFGTYSIDPNINAGLDLEMPGINKWRTLDLVNRSISARKVTVRTIKQRATKVLELVQKCAKGAPEILDGDGMERTVERTEDNTLMRRLAAESIVLLKNTTNLLPLDLSCPTLKRVAIVGGNAKAPILSGGGSAALKASYFVSPYDGIVEALREVSGGEIEVSYCEGARAYKTLPTLDYELFTDRGERGWMGTWFSHTSDDSMQPLDTPISTMLIDETRIFISTSVPNGITRRWTLKLKGYLNPRPYDVDFEFGLTAAGRAKLYVDGKLTIDNWTRQRRGEAFFGNGSEEETGVVSLKANYKHEIVVEFCNVRGPADGDEDEAVMDSNPGVRLGGAEVQDPDKMMSRAVELAQEADIVIAVVGLNADWETEGYDRTTLALPGRTDELVAKVAEVNPKTVVITQSGSTITMPWVDKISSILHAWYLGNPTGYAIADVLFGKTNPSGKLSITFPKRLGDVPSHGHFHSENGQVRYAEDLFVGYKHYQHKKIEPLFPFGHGLSYTSFDYTNLDISTPSYTSSDLSLSVAVTVTNAGSVPGSEIVQLYVSFPSTSSLTHPLRQLKAFNKTRVIQPGGSAEVQLDLDKYAFSYWDTIIGSWVVEKGQYGFYVGRSSEDLVLRGTLDILHGLEWSGL